MAHQPIRNTHNQRLAQIIESRSPAGRHDAVQGWHDLLQDLLSQMAPYLREGRLVTFRQLKEPERKFFEKQLQRITVPATAQALYLPPSVRYQMLYQRPAGEPQPVPEHSPDHPPDEGIVLACRKCDYNVVINCLAMVHGVALTAHDGRLLAGYVYHTISECVTHLSEVMQIHLQPGGSRK